MPTLREYRRTHLHNPGFDFPVAVAHAGGDSTCVSRLGHGPAGGVCTLCGTLRCAVRLIDLLETTLKTFQCLCTLKQNCLLKSLIRDSLGLILGPLGAPGAANGRHSHCHSRCRGLWWPVGGSEVQDTEFLVKNKVIYVLNFPLLQASGQCLLWCLVVVHVAVTVLGAGFHLIDAWTSFQRPRATTASVFFWQYLSAPCAQEVVAKTSCVTGQE